MYKMEKQDIKQLVFFILMVILIIVLIIAIVTLIKDSRAITTDAITYGMKKYNFTSCNCIDSSGHLVSFGG